MDYALLDPKEYVAIPGMTRNRWEVFRFIQLTADAQDDSSCLTADIHYPDEIICVEDPSEPWAVFKERKSEIWIQKDVHDYARDVYLEYTGVFIETPTE